MLFAKNKKIKAKNFYNYNMNITKYLKKLNRNIFLRTSKFKSTYIINEDESFKIQIEKVSSQEDIAEYIMGLHNFKGHSYLLSPRSWFSTYGFKTDIDVVIINTSFRIAKVYHKFAPKQKINFEGNFYNVLILESGLAQWFNLKQGDKLYLTKAIF